MSPSRRALAIARLALSSAAGSHPTTAEVTGLDLLWIGVRALVSILHDAVLYAWAEPLAA